jgi:hypothetical protein
MVMRRALWVGVLVMTVGLAGCASSDPDPTATSSALSGVQTYSDLSQDHTEEDVDYPQTPPVGGEHDPAWLNCNGEVYPKAVRDENAVHSLEHGAVWITYQPELPDQDVAALTDRVDGEPYSFASPYPGQPAPVMLTAWGIQLSVDSADDERIDDFLTEYRQGPQTPEPGATCDDGVMP